MNMSDRAKISAAVDLAILALMVMGAWSLRFLGVQNVGAITMALALLTVLVLMKLRGNRYHEVGLGPLPPFADLLRMTMNLLPWFGLAWLAGALIGIGLFGRPQAASAVTQLPQDPWAFLLDIAVVTWLLIAFGEETVFRGFVLDRLLRLVGSSRAGTWIAIVLQAAWFGSLHASQGLSGMVMTGTIGLVFGWYYLEKLRGNLWPLIIVHGSADTVLLTAAWLTR